MVNKIEHKDNIQEISDELLGLIDMLRGSLYPNDYHIILLLLSTYKDGLINVDSLPDFNRNVSRNIPNISQIKHYLEFSISISEKYESIYKIYDPILQKIPSKSLESIIKILLNIDIDILSKYFDEIFDNLLYQLININERKDTGIIQPLEISRFIINLIDLKKGSTVFNPFAGLASFGVFLKEDIHYLGKEVNRNTWCLGSLRLMAHNKTTVSIFRNSDSILTWPENEKFDLIVSQPPFGVKMDKRSKNSYPNPNINTVEQFFLDRGISSLNKSGKLIAILPLRFLYNGGKDKEIRKELIENDLLEMIITFPSGLLTNTNSPFAIIVINKDKSILNRVRLVDAKHFLTIKHRNFKLDDSKLLEYIKTHSQDNKNDTIKKSQYGESDENEFLLIVSNNKIKKLNYNLSIKRYFLKDFEGVKLREITFSASSIPRGLRTSRVLRSAHSLGVFAVKKMFKLKYVKIADLKDDNIDFQLDVQNIKDIDIPKNAKEIAYSCLLVSLRWKKLKPTYFEYGDESIFISKDIMPLSINRNEVDIHYLINELHLEYVNKQVEAYSIDSSIPFIKKEDLLNIKINLPSIQEQRAKVQGLMVLAEKIKDLQHERNNLEHGFTTKQHKEFESLKHSLGTSRQNILSYTEALITFFEKEKSEPISKVNEIFRNNLGEDLVSVFNTIKEDINFISELLEKGENGLILSKYPLKNIPLIEVQKLFNELNQKNFKFNIKFFPLKDINKKELGILTNKTLLKILIDNIFTNADKHGFEKKNNKNEVIIELSLLNDLLIIDIKNNGKPFPKNFDKEKFILKYTTNSEKGTGQGGYDIDRIAQYFKNENWNLILNEDILFPVRFNFQFPIVLIK